MIYDRAKPETKPGKIETVKLKLSFGYCWS